MQYPTLKKRCEKSYSYPPLSGGVNFNASRENIADNQLSGCDNFWFQNGMLSSRKGVNPKTDITDIYSNRILMPLKTAQIKITVNGAKHQIAYCLEGDFTSYQRLRFFALESSGALKPIGVISFNRIASDEYYKLQNIFLISGRKKHGCGVYAFISRKCDNFGYMYEIYELSENFGEWIKLLSDDFYVPTVYMYGKGTMYQEAPDVHLMNEPTVSPEGFNLITTRCKAYFSTDEVSSEFVLPVKNLSDKVFECRVYSDRDEYTRWVIPAGSDSATVQFRSSKIKVTLNRSSGSFRFSYEDNTAFGVPRMGRLRINNLLVIAHRAENRESAIMECEKTFSHNSDIYVYGSKGYKNTAFLSSKGNPLYFPENLKVSVGDELSPITAIAAQQNKVIVFKPNEIYRISKGSQGRTTQNMLADSEYDFLSGSSLKCEAVHSEIGCVYPDTVCLCGNKLVWASESGKIYTLNTTTYGKENNIYELSLPIIGEIVGFGDRLLEATAVSYGGYYILFCQNRAYLLDYKIQKFGIHSSFSGLKGTTDSISWYIWSFPAKLSVSAACDCGEGLALFCMNKTAERMYSAFLEGECDSIIAEDGHREDYDISSCFELKNTDFGSVEKSKNIEFVFLEYIAPSEAILELIADRTTQDHALCKTNELKLSKIRASMRSKSRFAIRVSAKGSFSLNRCTVIYNEEKGLMR